MFPWANDDHGARGSSAGNYMWTTYSWSTFCLTLHIQQLQISASPSGASCVQVFRSPLHFSNACAREVSDGLCPKTICGCLTFCPTFRLIMSKFFYLEVKKIFFWVEDTKCDPFLLQVCHTRGFKTGVSCPTQFWLRRCSVAGLQYGSYSEQDWPWPCRGFH